MRNGQNDFEAAVPGPLPYSSNPQMMRWKVPASFFRVTFVPRQRESVCVVVGGWGVGGCKARDGRARAMSARKGRRRQNRGCSDSLFSGLAIFGSVKAQNQDNCHTYAAGACRDTSDHWSAQGSSCNAVYGNIAGNKHNLGKLMADNLKQSFQFMGKMNVDWEGVGWCQEITI